jgi:PAS domain-containing protein
MDYRIVEASPGIRAILLPNTPDFTIVTVSDDYVSSAGMPREILKGRGFFERFPGSPEDKDFTGETTIRASLEYVLRHKAPHLVTRQRYDIPNGDGTFAEKYWKAQNVPVLDETGEVSYLIHTAEDITGQVKAENRQLEIEGIEKAYHLFMQAPMAVCIVSGEQHLVELANNHMLQLLGRTAEMIGKPIGETLTEAKKQGLISALDGVFATGKPYHAPVFPAELLINGVREKRYFDLVFQSYYQNQGDVRPTSIICIAYNITEQVRARQKLQ